MTKKLWPVLSALVVVMTPLPIAAQGLDTLSSRAAALGAFVAVADDASAVAWNPAGLVIGPFFNMTVDFGRSRSDPDSAPAALDRAGRSSTTLIALAVPPLGLSYYRIASTVAAPIPAEAAGPRRQDGQVVVRSMVTSHLGATVVQSVSDHLTLGTTVKLVHGRVSSGAVTAETWGDVFDRAEMLESHASTSGDLDTGVMFALRRLRAGVVVRNVLEPTFGDERTGVEASLKRHARVGLAWGDRWPGMPRTVLAVDADLTRVAYVDGDRRDVAAGVERWLRNQQIGLRGGVRASTIGAKRPIASGGVSYAVRAGTYVDAHFARGEGEHRTWGITARLTY